MNQDNMSSVLWYLWIIAMGVLGALNLRSIVRNSRTLTQLQDELKAEKTKNIMLEAKIIFYETKLTHDNTSANRDSK